ncbi:MAG: lipopolysaccharide biosynthesis protein [Methylocystis sp.]|uniref:lipopolysaccharide biosynthesis protein n=1 Tax=Methylocystis sp. TaxID=1911079 RepID=UPI003D114F19
MMSRLAGLADKARSQKDAIAAVVAMSIKGFGALLTIAVFTLAARAMSAGEFGRLAIWFNAMSFLAVAAVFGQETLIARSWGEYNGKGQPGVARAAYRFGWIATIVSALVFACGVYFLVPFLDRGAPTGLFLTAALFLFLQTLLHYSSHATRVMLSYLVSETGREILWRLVLLVVVLWATLDRGLTLRGFFLAAAVGMALSLAFQLRAVWRKLRDERVAAAAPASERRRWFERGLAMWLSAVVEAASQYSDVMLIGYFASPAAAGEYFVAARIANIFLMVQTGLNNYSVSHSASLYFSGNAEKLQRILRSLIIVAAALVTPCLLLIYLFGAQILTIFGERYASVYPTLVTLSTAAYVMCLSGSASVILLTTGHEKLYSRVISLATIVRLSLTALLAAKFGALGAACGWAFVNGPLFMALAVVCRRIGGVDPSIASVFRPAARGSTAGAGQALTRPGD